MDRYDILSLVYILFLLGIVGCAFALRRRGKVVGWISLSAVIAVGAFIQYLGIGYDEPVEPGIRLVTAVFSAIKMTGGDFKEGQLSALMAESAWYFAAVVAMQTIAFANGIVVVVGIIGRRLFNAWRLFLARHAKRTYVVVGDNDYASAFLDNVAESGQSVRIIHVIPEDTDDLFGKAFAHASRPGVASGTLDDAFMKRIVPPRRTGTYDVVSFIEDDAKNLKALDVFSRRLASLDERLDAKAAITGRFMYTEYEHARVMAPIRYDRDRIRLFSRHDLIDRAFLDRYPLSSLFPVPLASPAEAERTHVRCHYYFIGFGNTNREILRRSIINNQFDDVTVSYLVLTRDARKREELFLRDIPAFQDENAGRGGLLPQSPHVAKPIFKECEMLSSNFYVELTQSDPAGAAFSVFVVALGEDVENINVAHAIDAFLQPILPDGNYRIFAKSPQIEGILQAEKKATIVPFGLLREVFTPAYVIDEKTDVIAKIVNECYNGRLSDAATNRTEREAAWSGLSLHDQDASRFVAMNLRSKLHLLGLDYVPIVAGGADPDGTEGAKKYYQSIGCPDGLPPAPDPTAFASEGAFEEHYSRDSVRTRLAVQEHLRWNAFMTLAGWMPLSISAIVTNKDDTTVVRHKDEARRLHACITTREGLVRLYGILVAAGIPSRNADKIALDYTTIDHLPEILKQAGYRIVERTAA